MVEFSSVSSVVFLGLNGIPDTSLQQLVILTESEMGVFDLRERKLVEQLKFDFSSLMSPSIANTVNGNVNYQNSIRDVSHSMRIYKGKIFLLVRCNFSL